MGHVVRLKESRNIYRVSMGRPEGKRPLGRPRSRWEYNIERDLKEVNCDDRNFMSLTQDRAYLGAVMNLRRGRVIGISGSLIWSKTTMELIFNPSGEFR